MIHADAIKASLTSRIMASTDLRFVDRMEPYDQRWTFAAFSEGDPALARQIKKKSAA
jgi:phytanoyl-CoA hydroxylase